MTEESSSSSDPKYECQVCEEKGFKSRSDWLFHLVLNRHSVKARESIQQLYLLSNGGMFVVTGVENVDRTLLLDHVANKLPSFTNFVCFKPQADICMIVCEPGDFAKFSSTPQYVTGRKLKFRDYNEISPNEWKAYFEKKPPVDDPDVICLNPLPAPTPSKRKIDTVGGGNASESQRKIPRLLDPSKTDFYLRSNKNKKAFVRSFIRSQTLRPTNWADELKELYESIMLSEAQRNIRLNIIEDMKKLLKANMPKCELIPVGGDFLGFNIDTDVFTMYLDSRGVTTPVPDDESEKIRIIDETHKPVDRARNWTFKALRLAESEGPLVSKVKCNGAFCIEFEYLVYGLIRVDCRIVLHSFKLAQTSLLCKKLFFTSPKVMSLVSLAVYWASKRIEIAQDCLANPYIIYWLVYYFMMTKKILPPAIDLQKSCSYEIIHDKMKVEFSYDSSLPQAMVKPSDLQTTNVESDFKLLLEWFTFIDETLRLPGKNVQNIFRCVVCPRYGQLVEKAWLKCLQEKFDPVTGHLLGAQESSSSQPPGTVPGGDSRNKRRTRQNAGFKLKGLGFEESTWEALGNLEQQSALCIQHPFYISDNMSMNVDDTFFNAFFGGAKSAKERLAQLLASPGRKGSFLDVL